MALELPDLFEVGLCSVDLSRGILNDRAVDELVVILQWKFPSDGSQKERKGGDLSKTWKLVGVAQGRSSSWMSGAS